MLRILPSRIGLLATLSVVAASEIDPYTWSAIQVSLCFSCFLLGIGLLAAIAFCLTSKPPSTKVLCTTFAVALPLGLLCAPATRT